MYMTHTDHKASVKSNFLISADWHIVLVIFIPEVLRVCLFRSIYLFIIPQVAMTFQNWTVWLKSRQVATLVRNTGSMFFCRQKLWSWSSPFRVGSCDRLSQQQIMTSPHQDFVFLLPSACKCSPGKLLTTGLLFLPAPSMLVSPCLTPLLYLLCFPPSLCLSKPWVESVAIFADCNSH